LKFKEEFVMSAIEETRKNGFRSNFSERAFYGSYFLGQNIFYMLVLAFLIVYFTDMGIPASTVAVIALIVKVWDAVNDPLFGGIVDRVRFKKGKFLPWLRISLVAIPAATIFLFAMQQGMSLGLKIVWATIGYILWDMAYTVCDVPIFGLVTTITDNPQERTTFISFGRVLSRVGTILVSVLIGSVRQAMGGWLRTVIVLSVIGLITMIPVCFTAKERFVPSGGGKELGIKEIFGYVLKNKYLLIFFGSAIIWRGLSIDGGLGMYIVRYNLGSEAFITLLTILNMVPSMVFTLFIPAITKRIDKFQLFSVSMLVYIGVNVIFFFVGYKNIPVYVGMLIIRALASLPINGLLFFFTPDCVEYGRYATGISAPGVSFSIQTFAAKMFGALSTAGAAFALSLIGFVEGEGAVQAAGFPDKLWAVYFWVPIAACLIATLFLRQYKLRDKYVKVMTDCNNGVIDRDEAEQLIGGAL
jgi:probable glucitol transport protein GutA